jgi:hypothetical protein
MKSLAKKLHKLLGEESFFDLFSMLRSPLESFRARSETLRRAIAQLERGYLLRGGNFINFFMRTFFYNFFGTVEAA